MTAIGDLWAALKGAGIALDKDEAAALGGPAGETISVWAAMSARHGNLFAHLVCLGLWLVQARHCQDQITGVPMTWWNYLKAVVLLVLFAPLVPLIWLIRRAVVLMSARVERRA